jgi:hypothetical protein
MATVSWSIQEVSRVGSNLAGRLNLQTMQELHKDRKTRPGRHLFGIVFAGGHLTGNRLGNPVVAAAFV